MKSFIFSFAFVVLNLTALSTARATLPESMTSLADVPGIVLDPSNSHAGTYFQNEKSGCKGEIKFFNGGFMPAEAGKKARIFLNLGLKDGDRTRWNACLPKSVLTNPADTGMRKIFLRAEFYIDDQSMASAGIVTHELMIVQGVPRFVQATWQPTFANGHFTSVLISEDNATGNNTYKFSNGQIRTLKVPHQIELDPVSELVTKVTCEGEKCFDEL